jgi:hypothetical protein
MEIIRNLTDEQLTDLLVEDDERALQRDLPAIAQAARTATDFDRTFWIAQQVAIRERINSAAHKHRRLGALVWATAAAMILFGALNLDQHSATVQQTAQTDQDQQLMIAVQEAVDNAGPSALEPAGLLASEINEAYQQSSVSQAKDKESGNEN